MRRKKAWKVYPEQPDLVAAVMARHNLPRLVARILLNRGLAAADDILAFIDPSLERLNPPFDLPDLEAAAARLGRAVRQGEPVAVYGDYDADGITATAMLHQFFRELGLTCFPYIPDRLTQGYGLKTEGLKELAAQARLIVTVDCGISDAQEVAWAKAQGLEVIITDHHEIPPELPDALAVVNPKRLGHAYPFGELAGVGVALLLALGVRADLRAEGWFSQRREPNLRSYLDLVALGTAADVVPLVGENRILVRQGLKVLEESRRPGIIALKEVTQLEGKPISYQNVVFQLAPRLNAAGRMGQARCALELLLSDDLAQARVQARYLHNLNRQRQALEEEVLKQARAIIRQRNLSARPVLLLAGEDWHPGVIGIVAARLADEYHRPAALVSLKNGRGRGSARSVEGFHLFKGLTACRQALHKYGGHAAAAGFEVAADQLPALQDLLDQAFHDQVGPEPLRPALKVDAQVELPDLDHAFNRHLETLRPFGPGNPAPVIVCLGVECLGSRVVNQRHLKVQLAQGGNVLEAIAFNMAAHHPLNGTLDVALGARISNYQGRTSLDLRLLDWGKP
ncbi:MAG: single-stranded-DNA-specific exonuclease RecJ [Desulfobacca sp. RBG_16_60_12]|nr:MAG: single-stranded-DNA-specific exonuclease RecJ [Desulfobacca sp. RBG_16_60_12]